MYRYFKSIIDFLTALILLSILFPLLIFLFCICSITTKSWGLYQQTRIGYRNEPFRIYKFKSMVDVNNNSDFITDGFDTRITQVGSILRKTKLDELPQLLNVLMGQMSFVGPRPDVMGYAELLPIQDQYLNSVKPGISSPASLYFKNEEFILSKVDNKVQFNDSVIWPIKAKMNISYSKEISFTKDLKVILQTLGLLTFDTFTN